MSKINDRITVTLPLADWHLILRIVSFAKRWELISNRERAQLKKLEDFLRQENLPL